MTDEQRIRNYYAAMRQKVITLTAEGPKFRATVRIRGRETQDLWTLDGMSGKWNVRPAPKTVTP